MSSNTAQIIPLFTRDSKGENVQICNARDLHAKLQVGKDFSTWIKNRIDQYGFQVDEDFFVAETLSSPNLGSAKARQQKMIDYHITLDMAKELAMIENNDQGRAIRKYFITVEKQARKVVQVHLPGYRPDETREVHAGGLTLEQQDAVKALHKTLVEAAPQDQRGALAVKLWSSVKKKFGVSYKDVPPADFTSVLSLMSRVAIDGEYLPKQELPNALHELPKAGTSPLEFIFSTEVAEARERVYQWLAKCRSAMLAAGAGEPGWPEIDATDFAHAAILETVRNAKFCVGFGEKGALQVSVIPSNAAIATAEQLPDLIRMGSQVPDKVLPKIIQAVASRM